jgi:hypothetical protein
VEKMKQLAVKADSEGKILLPLQVQKELGNIMTLKKTPKGYLLTSKQYVANEKLEKIINSPHCRTGIPHNVNPEEMKSIWDPTKRDPSLKGPHSKHS